MIGSRSCAGLPSSSSSSALFGFLLGWVERLLDSRESLFIDKSEHIEEH